jgi:hypothetical protein
MTLMIALVLLGAALVQPSCRRYLWIAALFVAFFMANQVSSELGRRWEFPYLNVFAQRILPDDTATRYFSGSGMPASPQLEAMAYRWASSDRNAFYNDPNLGEFRHWLRSRGRLTYLQWLLADPGWSFSEPIMELDDLFGPSCAGYFSPAFAWPLPSAIEVVVGYPREGTPVLWWLAGIAAGVAMGVKSWRLSPLWAVALTLVLLVYPHACLVWHGDAMEVTRHALQAKIEFQLGLWLLGLLALDHRPADPTTTPLEGDPA